MRLCQGRTPELYRNGVLDGEQIEQVLKQEPGFLPASGRVLAGWAGGAVVGSRGLAGFFTPARFHRWCTQHPGR